MAGQSEGGNEPTCSIKCMEGQEKCASWRLCVHGRTFMFVWFAMLRH